MILHAILLAVTHLVAVESSQGHGGFSFESVQLSQTDIASFSALRFGNASKATANRSGPACRAWPESDDWPSQDEWRQLNASLDGALLQPIPVGSACYQGKLYDAARCRWLVQQAGRTHFWIEDPLVVLTQWPQGSTCMAELNARGVCIRGGFPEYVVNATTVKHIQAAVNFARNRNVRVVIK